MMRMAILAGAAGLALFIGGATADQKDERLPAFFLALRDAPNPLVAQQAEMAIWSIWAETGDPALDRILAEGIAAMAERRFSTALARFDDLIRRRPDFAEGWNKRATLYYLMQDYPASLADIDRTLELEPRHFGALAGLGLVNAALGRDAAALDAFERVLHLYPLDNTARVNRAVVKKRLDEKSL